MARPAWSRFFADGCLEGKPCTIFGDGKQTRDYVFVGDVVRANIAAANSNVSGAINVGTGIETNVNELYHTLGTVADVTRAPEYAPARPGEQSRSVISPARAGELLNWRPRSSWPTASIRPSPILRSAPATCSLEL